MMKKHIEYTIRQATLHDAEAISQIHIASWQKAYKDYIPESLLINLPMNSRAELWFQAIKAGACVQVIETKEHIVGFVSLVFHDDHTKSAEIKAIYLHPHYWHKGLGTKLCDYIMPIARQRGSSCVCIWVLEGNKPLRSFYESLHFNASGASRLQAFYEHGPLLTELQYKIDLTQNVLIIF